MGRIPEDELERIKREVDLVALVGAGDRAAAARQGPRRALPVPRRGRHALARHHARQGPVPCFACDAGGDVIEWTRRTEGVSFRHAVEILRAGGPPPLLRRRAGGQVDRAQAAAAGGVRRRGPGAARAGSSRTTTPPSRPRLRRSPIRKRGIDDPQAITTFQLGVCG